MRHHVRLPVRQGQPAGVHAGERMPQRRDDQVRMQGLRQAQARQLSAARRREDNTNTNNGNTFLLTESNRGRWQRTTTAFFFFLFIFVMRRYGPVSTRGPAFAFGTMYFCTAYSIQRATRFYHIRTPLPAIQFSAQTPLRRLPVIGDGSCLLGPRLLSDSFSICM